MKNVMLISLVSLVSTSGLVGCAPMTSGSTDIAGAAPAAAVLAIPRLTDPVGGQSASSMSVSEKASDVSSMTVPCSGCTNFNVVKQAVNGVLGESSYVDFQSCQAEVAVKYLNPTLSETGKAFYMSESNGQVTYKILINAPNKALKTFTVYKCAAGVQNWFTKVDNTSSPTTGLIKIIQSSVHYQGLTTGTYANGQWTAKNVTVASYTPTSTRFDFMDQTSAYTTIQHAINYPGSPALSSNLWARLQISGDAWKTLTFGLGSTNISRGGAAAQVIGFDPANNVEAVSSVGTYGTEAAASTRPTAPSPTITFGAGETWDCTVPAGETVTSYLDIYNQHTTEMQVCSDKY